MNLAERERIALPTNALSIQPANQPANQQLRVPRFSVKWLFLRLKDLLGSVTRVNKKKKKST